MTLKTQQSREHHVPTTIQAQSFAQFASVIFAFPWFAKLKPTNLKE